MVATEELEKVSRAFVPLFHLNPLAVPKCEEEEEEEEILLKFPTSKNSMALSTRVPVHSERVLTSTGYRIMCPNPSWGPQLSHMYKKSQSRPPPTAPKIRQQRTTAQRQVYVIHRVIMTITYTIPSRC